MANYDDHAGLVVISSSDHCKAVVDALRKLFDFKPRTDCDFRWNGKSVRAHRIILELFLAPEIIDSQPVPSPDLPVVKQEAADDICKSGNTILDAMIEFLYKGEVAVPEKRLEDLLVLARQLDFKILVDAIVLCYGSKNINAENKLDLKIEDDKSHSVNELNVLDPYEVAEGSVTSCEVDNDTCSSSSFVSDEFTPFYVNPGRSISTSGQRMKAGGVNTTEDTHLKCVKTSQECLNLESSSDLECSTFEQLDCQGLGFKSGSEERLHNSVFDAQSSAGACSPDEVPVPEDLVVLQYSDEEDDEQEASISTGIASVLNEGADATYKCPHCQYEATKYFGYSSHLLAVHGLTLRGQRAKEHKCTECDYLTFKISNLKSHVRANHSKRASFSCPYCKYVVKIKENLDRHLSSVHGVDAKDAAPQKVYRCAYCKFEAATCTRRNYHVLRVHGLTARGEPAVRHKCPECDFTALFMSKLKIHQFCMHSS